MATGSISIRWRLPALSCALDATLHVARAVDGRVRMQQQTPSEARAADCATRSIGGGVTRNLSSDMQQSDLFDAPQELPQGLIYQPEFLTRDEESALLAAIAPLPLREAQIPRVFRQAPRRAFPHAQTVGRLAAMTAVPTHSPAVRCRRSSRSCATRWRRGSTCRPRTFVHALVSEYRPGTPIGWHRDKPAYGIVVGISLAGWGRMRFRPYAAQDARHTLSLDLAPRSLYVMRDADPLAMAAQHAADAGVALFDHAAHRGCAESGTCAANTAFLRGVGQQRQYQHQENRFRSPVRIGLAARRQSSAILTVRGTFRRTASPESSRDRDSRCSEY